MPRRLPLLALPLTLAACQTSVPDTVELAAPEAASSAAAEAHVQAATPVEAGRYLAIVGGCNDCHTAGYLEAGGTVPEADWLMGSPVGFRGPWGTTYPSNLRLTVDQTTEDDFVELLHTRDALPPMPWMNVNRMNEADARALYRFIASLGPAGAPAPTAVPPGEEPATPYVDFVPQHLERLAAGPPPDSVAS